MRRFSFAIGILAMAIGSVPACTDEADVEDGIDDAFPDGKADGGIDEGSPEALGPTQLHQLQALTRDRPERAGAVRIGTSGRYVTELPMRTNDVVLVTIDPAR